MHFATIFTTVLAAGTAAATHSHIAKRNIKVDLSGVSILDIVSALVDKLPIDGAVSDLTGGLLDLTQVNVQAVLNCVVDELPLSASVNLFPMPTTSAGKTFTVTRTHTVYVSPTQAPSVGRRDVDVELANVPILSLISGLLDKLPIDASIKVLPGGLSDLTDLSDINLLNIVTCILKNLGITV
ncbi:hypothetical protein N7490_012000 [Penicillium lividum]|nr:hypothetical protein N7490_012000 [Penicillium lividum]